MSSLPRYAIVLGLALSCAGLSTAGSSQTKTQKKSAMSSVSGRITIHGKGAAGIVVGVRSPSFSPQPTPAFKATTDPEGNYRITDIPAGSYEVLPMAPAYIVSGQASSRMTAKTLLLGEGEDVQGIDFSLNRGGVIAGKVMDADGRPVIEERLTVVQDVAVTTRSETFPVANTFQTDDRGVYRIYGLPPGRYKIFVGVADEGSQGNVRFGRVIYKRTFYPDVTETEEAKVIALTEGAEATNIDITVGRSLPGFVASGRVVDGETGQPVMGLRFGVRRAVNDRDTNVMGIFTASNSRGEFRLENLAPGKYSVFIARQMGSEARADPVPFEVIDQDVTGLLLKTIKGLTITGTVVLEGGYDKSVFAQLVQMRLQGFVRGEKPNSDSWQESAISADGSFRLGGLGPGKVNFSLNSNDRRPAVSFSILRIEREGVAQPRIVDIKADEQPLGVTIVVRYGTGSVRGEVKLENGTLPTNGRLSVWIKKVGDTEASPRPQSLDARGHFLIEGVAAGSYELNVNAYMPGRRPSPAAKQLIEISEGTVTNVIVTLDLKPDSDQLSPQ